MKYDPKNKRWIVHYSLTDPASDWRKVYEWCWETFGHPGTDPDSGAYHNWDYHGGYIYFYDEKCVTMFTLRWS